MCDKCLQGSCRRRRHLEWPDCDGDFLVVPAAAAGNLHERAQRRWKAGIGHPAHCAHQRRSKAPVGDSQPRLKAGALPLNGHGEGQVGQPADVMQRLCHLHLRKQRHHMIVMRRELTVHLLHFVNHFIRVLAQRGLILWLELTLLLSAPHSVGSAKRSHEE